MDGEPRRNADLGGLFVSHVQSCAIVLLDPDGLVLEWNAGARRIVGYEADEIVGRHMGMLYTAEDVSAGEPGRHLADTAALGHVAYEGWRVRKDGSRFWADVSVTAVYAAGELVAFGELTRDITESRRFQKELLRRALHDALTGLPNRTLFLDRLCNAMAHTERHRGLLALFFVDLDRFKAINDSLGHEAGDRILVTVAQRLTASVRSEDTVARLSGDEFVILCADLDGQETANRIGERVVRALTRPVRLGDVRVLVHASIGLAVTNGGTTDRALLREADAAMYRAKRAAPDGGRIRVACAQVRPPTIN